MVDQNKIDEIIKRLDILVKISGLNLIQKFKTNKEKIEFLANLGLESGEIIALTGIPSKTVYNTISEMKKN
jgi:hypothetical protein